jgi:hypothetical protein
MAVLTEAIEAGEGAEAARVIDAALAGTAAVTTTAPAVTSTVAEDAPAVVLAHLMTAITAPRDGSVMKNDAGVVAVTVKVAALAPAAGILANPQSSTRMSETSELSLCNNSLLV